MRGWLGTIVRFIVSAFVLLAIGFFLPGFTMLGFVNALIAALVIAVIGYVVEALLGEGISPRSRGVVGFVTSAAVIFLAQYVVPGLGVTVLGALIAALIIGVVDAFVPTELR